MNYDCCIIWFLEFELNFAKILVSYNHCWQEMSVYLARGLNSNWRKTQTHLKNTIFNFTSFLCFGDFRKKVRVYSKNNNFFLDRLRMCTVFCFARVARVYTCEYIEIFPGAKLVILVRVIYLIKSKSYHKALTYLLTYILLQEAFSILELT